MCACVCSACDFIAGVALALVDLPSFFLGIVGHRALLPKPSPPAPVSALPQPLPLVPNELWPSPAAATRCHPAPPARVSTAGACEHRRRGVHSFTPLLLTNFVPLCAQEPLQAQPWLER